MNQLIKYEAACRAVAECVAVDEVKDLHDKAAAMLAYGRMAKDKTLQSDASEIALRAERRLGELLAAQKTDGGLNSGAKLMGALPGANDGSTAVVNHDRRPKLADAGISKDLSSRAQKIAAVPEAQFEAELAAKREREKQDGVRVTARLERAGEKAIKAKTAAQIEADRIDDDANEGFDPIAELEAAHKEIAALHAQLDAVNAADQKAETLKWKRLHQVAERTASEKSDNAQMYQAELKKMAERLTRIGKLFGERDPHKVPALVEAFYRKHAQAAA